MPVIKGEVKARDQDLFFGYRRLHQGIDGKAIISGHHKLLKEAKEDGRVPDVRPPPGSRENSTISPGNMPENVPAADARNSRSLETAASSAVTVRTTAIDTRTPNE